MSGANNSTNNNSLPEGRTWWRNVRFYWNSRVGAEQTLLWLMSDQASQTPIPNEKRGYLQPNGNGNETKIWQFFVSIKVLFSCICLDRSVLLIHIPTKQKIE